MVEIAIIPNMPSKMEKLSNAYHIRGIMVRAMNPPLKVMFFSLSSNFFFRGWG